jgi:hypothetical protein
MPFRLLRDSFTQITSPHTPKELTLKRPARMAPTVLITHSKIHGANGLIGSMTVLASMSSPAFSTINFRQNFSIVHQR